MQGWWYTHAEQAALLVVVGKDDLGGLLGHVDVLGEGAVQLVLLLLHVGAELLQLRRHHLVGLTQLVRQRASVCLVTLSSQSSPPLSVSHLPSMP